MNLDNFLLEQFITTFYGSGNYAGDYWFVGMEEGGGNTLERVVKRLETWQKLGRQELVDIYDFHLEINYPEYFTDPVKLQRTWMQQARIILASKGLPTTIEDVRAYQRDIIGRKNSETCLLELLPLPSPSTQVWNYNEWSKLPYLKDRKTFLKYCIPWRCDHIHSQIRTYQPKLVVFLGMSYFQYWQEIVGQEMIFQNPGDFTKAKLGNTLFLIVKHPATMGIKNAYFEKIGSSVKHGLHN